MTGRAEKTGADEAAPALPVHTPYDGSSAPFSIGLKPLDIADWIEPGRDLAAQLAEKDRLYRERPSDVFVEEPETRAAQQEVLDLLLDHLPARYPDLYRRDGAAMTVAGRTVDHSEGIAPLRLASLLVAEDLILMRKGDDGWRLAAGALCFPSSWTLAEKFGRPLHDIHGPVPGFGAGSRPAGLIERMFDGLQGQAVLRFNWSLQAGDALYRPFSNRERDERAAARPSAYGTEEALRRAYVRVERQTLRKLPVSRDILFTIRIHLDPLAALADHPDRARLAAAFAGQLTAMEPAQLDYKGLAADRDRLVAWLEAVAGR